VLAGTVPSGPAPPAAPQEPEGATLFVNTVEARPTKGLGP
jgi:hypothetical protein